MGRTLPAVLRLPERWQHHPDQKAERQGTRSGDPRTTLRELLKRFPQSAEAAKAQGLTPKARIVAMAAAGAIDPGRRPAVNGG